MELVDMICERLGVEIGEDWQGKDGNIYRIEEDGKLIQVVDFTVLDATTTFETELDIKDVLTGKIQPDWRPKNGEHYYVPSLDNIDENEYYQKKCWGNTYYGRTMLENGLVFKTKEEAESVAREMIALAKHGI